jgi:hypothetical protein
MIDRNFEKQLVEAIGGPQLWRLRRKTSLSTGRALEALGVLLQTSASPKDPAYKQIVAISVLLRMAGELTFTSADLLSTGRHYAGAALLRQIVEIEYLTWTFKEQYRHPEKWLDSTFEERMQQFTPGQLRKTSKGRFLFKDYQDHCEQGGHPVPKGAALLDGSNNAGAQVLLADLITHCWRILDQIRQWSADFPPVQRIIQLAAPKMWAPLKKWSDLDPIYALMVKTSPDPDLKNSTRS